MAKPDKKQLSGIDKINILQALSIGSEELQAVLNDIAGEELISGRKLVNDLVIEYLGSNEETRITSGELRKSWIPVPQYYNAQGCKETLEACKMENCYSTNPQCFNRKLSAQIISMLDYFEEKRQVLDG